MNISQSLKLVPNVTWVGKKTDLHRTLRETNASFENVLGRVMDDVNALQAETAKAAERLMGGQAVDLHNVILAAEKAKHGIAHLMEIRNKAIDAYREILKMQL